MTEEFAKWLASLGVGGAIAGLLFYFYRKDVAVYVLQWKGMSDILIALVKDNIKVNTELRDAVYELKNAVADSHNREALGTKTRRTD